MTTVEKKEEAEKKKFPKNQTIWKKNHLINERVRSLQNDLSSFYAKYPEHQPTPSERVSEPAIQPLISRPQPQGRINAVENLTLKLTSNVPFSDDDKMYLKQQRLIKYKKLSVGLPFENSEYLYQFAETRNKHPIAKKNEVSF